MTEHDRIEARNAAASDYLRRHHQTRLASAVRADLDRSPRRIRRAATIAAVLVCAVLGVAATAHASPPPPVPAPALSWPTVVVERAAVKWLYATNPDEWADGVRLEEAVASCSRTGRRYRCEVVSLWSYASGDEHGEQRDVLTRCTPDRRVHRNAASARAARIVVRQGGTPGKRGGVRCARSTS